MVIRISLFILLVSVLSFASGYTRCTKLTDVKVYNNCIKNLIKEITPDLRAGIPEANIPSLEPMKFPALNVAYSFPLLQLKANMSDMQMLGFTNFSVEHVWIQPQNLTFSAKIRFPWVRSQMNYDVSGTFFILSASSAGFFDGNFTNNLADVFVTLKDFVDENGVERITVDKVNLNLKTSGVRISMNTPLKYRSIAKGLVSLINGNPKLALEIGLPFVAGNTAKVVQATVTDILKAFRKDELLPIF